MDLAAARKINELGDDGRGTGVPAVNVVAVDVFVNGITVGLQAALVGFAVSQAVVVTYAVGLAGAVLLVMVNPIGVFG